MGEEAKQQEQEQPKVEAPEKTEDNNKSPPPVILFVDLHCVGCAKKIERSIMRIEGVECVVVDMVRNQVTIRGGQVNPHAVCDRIMKKTRRRAKVLSPLPPPNLQPESEQPPTPASVDPSVSRPATKTVKLNVNMHCKACAGQLERKILKMEGVEKVETELGSRKVTVTGTMDANKLVDYVYRQTKKQAQIVPQPESVPKSKNQEGGADQNKQKDGEEKAAEDAGQGKEEDEEEKEKDNKEEGEKNVELDAEEVGKRMVNYYQYQQPLYVMERMPLPPPQLFSDENPNACSIS